MKKFINLLMIFLMCLIMAACKKDDPIEPGAVVLDPVDIEPVVDWEDVLREYIEKTKLDPNTNVVLYVEGNTIIEAQIIEGEVINPPKKMGYNFKGGITSDNVKYIDSTGRFIRKHNGNNILLLKASYEPIEFEVRFFKDNERIRELKQITVGYDQELSKDLHIGDLIDEKECIYGWKDLNGNLIAQCGDREVYISDLGDCVNYSDNTVDLHMDTVMICFNWERLDTYIITDEGFLNQTLNNTGKKYDCLEFSNHTDMEKLKELGYSTAHVVIECGVNATSGKQYLNILSEWPEDKKELEKCLLFESENIDLANKEEKSETYVKEVDIPLDKMGEQIYFAYNAGGTLAEDSWKSDVLAITVTFEK